MIGVAPECRHPPLHIGVIGPGARDRAGSAEDQFRRLRRQLPPGFGSARLHDHRPALYRPGDMQRTAYRKMFPLVVQPAHARGIEVETAVGVADEGIIGETVPEPGDDIIEFPRPAIALVMLHMVVAPEIQRRIRVGRGDDVPARPSLGDMVERGKAPGNMKGFIECRRSGRHQADPLRHHGQRGQKGKRLERGDRMAAAQRLDRHVQHGQVIGHEEGIEFPRLQLPDRMDQRVEVEIRVGHRARKAPGAGVNADRPHEGAQFQLPIPGHDILLVDGVIYPV